MEKLVSVLLSDSRYPRNFESPVFSQPLLELGINFLASVPTIPRARGSTLRHD
jgi:hypothetical protein